MIEAEKTGSVSQPPSKEIDNTQQKGVLRKLRSVFHLILVSVKGAATSMNQRPRIRELRHKLSGNVDGPVFIVGSGRSGTSVLLGAVHKTLDWPAHGEGHFHVLSEKMIETLNEYYRQNLTRRRNPKHLIHHIPLELARQKSIEMIRDIYHETYGTPRFVDKTPGPRGQRSLLHMQKVFPNMRVIYAKRRGIEVVRSACLKFPKTNFQTHCDIWQHVMNNWLDVRERLTVPYIEIDQYVMSNDPDEVAKQLKSFLQLTDKQTLFLSAYLKERRPQSSVNSDSGDVGLESVDWTENQVAAFRRACGSVMIKYGWSEDEAHFLSKTERPNGNKSV